MPKTKKCAFCRQRIKPTGNKAKDRRRFCSERCRRLGWKEVCNAGYVGLSKGTVGAVQELVVSVDLLKKGMQVFRAMSPNCDCDLAVLKDRKLIRVEVTTGYIGLNGKASWPKHLPGNYDVIAAVCNGRIYYDPPI